MWFVFLVAGSVRGEARQTLAGHLPKIVRRMNLQPVGRLPADTKKEKRKKEKKKKKKRGSN